MSANNVKWGADTHTYIQISIHIEHHVHTQNNVLRFFHHRNWPLGIWPSRYLLYASNDSKTHEKPFIVNFWKIICILCCKVSFQGYSPLTTFFKPRLFQRAQICEYWSLWSGVLRGQVKVTRLIIKIYCSR
jgi:hypothetical protein